MNLNRILADLETATEDQDAEMVDYYTDMLENQQQANEAAALATFKAEILPSIPPHDKIMQREAYNNYIDMLDKDGLFTGNYLHTLVNPF